MKWGLGSGNTWVNIDGSIMHETIGHMFTITEEHRLSFHDILLHLARDTDRMQTLTNTGTVTLNSRNVNSLGLDAPLLAILIHEAGQDLIIESLHAVTANL